GSFIMALGIDMLFSATYSIKTDWVTGIATIAAIVLTQALCKGSWRIMSINAGILVGIVVSYFSGSINLEGIFNAPVLGQPFNYDYMAFRILEDFDLEMLIATVLTVIPLALIAIGEHISDMLAISRTTGKDYLRVMGLPRTMSANGLAILVASVFGAPKTTAYTQTTGLIQLNHVCDPYILRYTALLMILLSFSPKVAALVGAIPMAVIGGITLVMYCMVILVGWRTIGSAGKERFSVRSSIIIVAVLGVALGVKFLCNEGILVGNTTLTSLTLALIAGILLNIIIPQRRHENAD
ncbi:MAG: solute carrier family 23 protein, partial [Prevotella sp.]